MIVREQKAVTNGLVSRMFGMATFQFNSLLLLLVDVTNNYTNIFNSIY